MTRSRSGPEPNRDVPVRPGDEARLPETAAAVDESRARRADAWASQSFRWKTTCPRTIVVFARPRSWRPANGVFRLLE